MSDNKIIVGISQGDINGIGLEVVLKTLMEPGISEVCTPVLFSSQKTVSYYRKVLGLEEFSFNPMREFGQLNSKKPNVFVCYEEEVIVEMGKSSDTGGKYAYVSLEKATQALLDGNIDVLVTAPINKSNIQSEHFKFVGHTEYLGDKLGGEPLMILCSENGLRVALVTGHLPLKDVAPRITIDTVSKKIKQLHESLVKDFGISKPKIAVLGLNPHAGDAGTIGNEDMEIIKPAIESTKVHGLVYGPYAADGFFGNETYKQFDGVLAMYHDQGLIPFKSIAFNNGVNFTAGLNAIRTSPDHGTAYDIAGKNLANEQSFKMAIYAAIDIYKKRKLYSEISGNPLPFGHIKKER
ncbi:4-hydroxythreonine-4-phosphate dehydrogenase PdxA [Aurantibacillus circumpalustris]|uniref:4-hydroxythreonine-4-phosphate dehydrogenase PdxA n=1 Tax=Aurantibacillus circumpalustris TaxID=3036359 RepID=UPI00295AC310|nr:4-hydroxythreonine-4-phosphate dehydrogenase PdxA [Aurantibacillus circumpalustris]